jgi:hypothetical protein
LRVSEALTLPGLVALDTTPKANRPYSHYRVKGVHEVHISDLERGAREPGLRTLGKIVAALDTTLLAILKGL